MGGRAELVFDGIDTFADVFLNGTKVGEADNMFIPHRFDVTDAILVRKTIAATHVIGTVEKALEVAGGAGFYRRLGLERLLRDAHGVQFHPLPAKRQHRFTGRIALGLDPIADA